MLNRDANLPRNCRNLRKSFLHKNVDFWDSSKSEKVSDIIYGHIPLPQPHLGLPSWPLWGIAPVLRTHRLTTKSSSAVFYNFPLASLLKGWPFINTKVKDAPVNCDNTLTHVKSHTSWGTAVCSGADPGGGGAWGAHAPTFIDRI